MRPRTAVLAPVHPLVSAAAPFTTAMVAAMEELGPVLTLSWRRFYPPLLHSRDDVDRGSSAARTVPAERLLDWADPRTWRAAVRRLDAWGAQTVVLPWVHPVMAPPYRWLLRHMPARVRRVAICHNVATHERVPLGDALTRATLRHADLLLTHAPQQRDELAALGLGAVPVHESFLPQLVAGDLAPPPDRAAVARERARLGDPELLLLAFGAVRPYKGVDLALEALARLRGRVDARLVVAGVFWNGTGELAELARRLGVADRVELRDEYVSNDDAALLFAAADASVLPYRSASQSGVVQLSFSHGRPVVATAVGGLPAAVRDGVDGLLCAPGDPEALADAIAELADRRTELTAGVRVGAREQSFGRYAEDLHDAVAALAPGVWAGGAAPRVEPRVAAEAVAR